MVSYGLGMSWGTTLGRSWKPPPTPGRSLRTLLELLELRRQKASDALLCIAMPRRRFWREGTPQMYPLVIKIVIDGDL